MSTISYYTAEGLKKLRDDLEYSLYTGVGPGAQYTLKPYLVQAAGDNVRVTNQ